MLKSLICFALAASMLFLSFTFDSEERRTSFMTSQSVANVAYRIICKIYNINNKCIIYNIFKLFFILIAIPCRDQCPTKVCLIGSICKFDNFTCRSECVGKYIFLL